MASEFYERADSGSKGTHTMGSTADKASGLASGAIGKAKQRVGKVVGSDKLQAEGAAQEFKVDAQKLSPAPNWQSRTPRTKRQRRPTRTFESFRS